MNNSDLLLCVDIGNTTIHLACFKDGSLLEPHFFSCENFEALDKHLKQFRGANLTYCSVVPQMIAHLKKQADLYGFKNVFELNVNTLQGLEITYKEPATIGSDRLANALAAKTLFGMPAIVVDLGTATTIDLIATKAGYVGGAIAPGLSAMTHYLQSKTALLPNFDLNLLQKKCPLIGQTTLEAMQLGLQKGYPAMIQALVDSSIEALQKLGETKEPVFLLTGGQNAEWFKETFSRFNYQPHLSLWGLREASRIAYKD